MTENALNGQGSGGGERGGAWSRGRAERSEASVRRRQRAAPYVSSQPANRKIPSVVQMLVFLWRSHYYECWCWVWSRRPPTVCYLSVSIVMVVVASTCFRPGASRCLRRGWRMRSACLRRLRRVKHRPNSQPTRTYMFLVRQVSLDIDLQMWPPINKQAKVINIICFYTISY